jgi:DNA helicase II / ATP-dependent DNA helicase PcrA
MALILVQLLRLRLLTKQLGPYGEMPYVGTFHGYCLRLLKTEGHSINIPPMTLLDDDDQEKLMKSILARIAAPKQYTPRGVLSAISRAAQSIRTAIPFDDQILSEARELYATEKRAARAADFDDLITHVARGLQQHEAWRCAHQSRVRHLLIDEYQDTNEIQHELLMLMSRAPDRTCLIDSLCAVGDEDQAIYSWRGATTHNIINFTREFRDVFRVTIDRNYRSAQPILDAANAVIAHNDGRDSKNLWSEKKATDRVRVVLCGSSYQEADIAMLCTERLRARGIERRSMAILYRSHYQSRSIEESLIRSLVPYRIVGGLRFYDRQEIKDLLAYIKIVVNPFDKIAVSRVLNVPARGLGEKGEELLMDFWRKHEGKTVFDVIELLSAEGTISGIRARGFRQFTDIFKDLHGQMGAKEILAVVIRRTSYTAYLTDAFDDEEARTKIENVRELEAAVAVLTEKNPQLTGIQFLDDVALLQEEALPKASEEHNAVTLMTLHSAKGLEFDGVIICGLEEGVLPSGQSVYEPAAVEEERRLLYVGMTRAKEYLLMLASRMRHKYGTIHEQRYSRFIKELPENVLVEECAGWRSTEIEVFLDRWFAGGQPLKKQSLSSSPGDFQKSTRMPVSPEKSGKYSAARAVRHEEFGLGTITAVDDRGNRTILTISFRSGVKKIDARFVTILPDQQI